MLAHRHKHVSYCLGCTLYSPGYTRQQTQICKFLQEEYSRYYKYRTREYVEKQEVKAIAIQTQMYDSVADSFDRVLDYSHNGSTPLQGQQDEQPEVVDDAENTIEYDTSDILTEYPPWSTEIHELNDYDENIYDRNRKELQNETDDNKSYIDNINAYNRDRALITQSLSDRLGLGQNSLPRAQQVIVATKHTDQMIDIPDHLKQISLDEEIETISHKGRHKNRQSIPQLDSTADSRDSLSWTPDSIEEEEKASSNSKSQTPLQYRLRRTIH